MNLRFYKTPYCDPIYPNIRRFLFEGKAPAKDDDREKDFYIYIWLNMQGYLHAFQAVLEDTITLAYQMPDRLSFGKMSRDVIHRGLTDRESSKERDVIIDVVDQMANESFPDMLEFIKRIVKGESVPEVKLSEEEMSLFFKLCGKG